jgi:hypothetical protein
MVAAGSPWVCTRCLVRTSLLAQRLPHTLQVYLSSPVSAGRQSDPRCKNGSDPSNWDAGRGLWLSCSRMRSCRSRSVAFLYILSQSDHSHA